MTRWIRSMGGPLVLLPRDALPVWTGAYGPSGEDDIGEEEETGYCWVGEAVEDYADAAALVQRVTWDPTAEVVANALRLLGSIRWQHETTWVSQGPS